jgi:hypothetical protein
VVVAASQSTRPPAEPFPWLELSPTFAFLLSVAVIGIGIAARSFALLAIGFAAIPCALIVAALLESLADRKALADMTEDDRVERDRIKVADAVARGLVPGAGPSPVIGDLPVLRQEDALPRRPAPAARRPRKGPVVAIINAVASFFGAIGGGS